MLLDRRLLRRARSVRLLLVVDALIGIAAALLVLGQAALMAAVAADAFHGASLRDVAVPLTLLVAVVTCRAGAAWAFEAAGRTAATHVLSELRLGVVSQRLRHRPAALDGARSGELATAAVAGVEALEAAFARYLPQLVLAVVVPVAVLLAVAAIDPIAAGVMLLTLPLVPVFMWLIGRQTERRARERWQALSLLATHFLDVVRGLPTLRAFNRGRAQSDQMSRIGEEYRQATMGTLRVAFLSGAVLELAATLGIALVAVTVGVRLVDGGIGFQAALTVLLLTPELYAPLRNTAAQFHASADGIAVAGRLLELVEGPAAVERGAMAPPSPRDVPVRLEGVRFRYPALDDDLLRGVDLVLEPGETVALVGESGVGKSTVGTLLVRLADPTAGRVVAGDTDLAETERDAWRRQVAWLPQKPTLFRGSIAENIRFGAPEASDEDVRSASRLVGADAFVTGLADGYSTIVGDGARALSAGQSQRIALARAFLRDAPLVILDEPTANLDAESAEIVGEAIERLREGRTVLLIVHRPELAARADRIVRLEAGRILESAVQAA